MKTTWGASVSFMLQSPTTFYKHSVYEDRQEHHSSLWTNGIFFPVIDQHLPAPLVKLLLLMAGVESNPGPVDWFCPVCTFIINDRKCKSVQCSKCKLYVHLRTKNNCSKLPIKKLTKAYPKDIWLCSKCEALSVPPPTPSPPPPSAINNIKILQFNINGICGKLTEL